MSQKIAIIIPTYNRKLLLVETVKSCLKQSNHTQLQMIICIVDDGSTDETDRCVAENFSNEKDVHFFKIENSERGAARNYGAAFVKKLSPDWLLFLDSDDILVENAFSKIARYFSQDYDLITGQFLLWDGENTFGENRPKAPDESKLKDDPISLFLDSSYICICTTFIKANIFYLSDGFSENRIISGSEDWYYFVKIVENKKIYFTQTVILYYRRYNGNTAASQTQKAILEIQSELFPYWLSKYEQKKSKFYIQKCTLLHSLMIVGAYNNEKKYRISYEKLFTIIKQNPSSIFNFNFIKTLIFTVIKSLTG